jgi:hypothetical protein
LNSSLDKTYRRFLLGIASEEDECSVEEAVLTDELDAILLHAAEDELIDDYLLGSLTDEERRGFEEQFLITEERRQRLRFASELIEYSQKQPADDRSVKPKLVPPGSIWFPFSWKHVAFLSAAASVVLAVLAGVGLIRLRQQTQAAQETRNELTRLQVASIAGSEKTGKAVSPSSEILSDTEYAVGRMPMIVFASNSRDVLPVLFHVPADTRYVRIDWKLSTPFAERYREVLLSKTDQLWAQEFPAAVLSPAEQSTIVLPASILVPGIIYHLRLDGGSARGQFEELADCTFRVVRE